MRRFLFDAAVFIYAVGVDHPYRESCREIVQLQGDGALAGEADVELLQELAHVRVRRTGDRTSTASFVRQVSSLCIVHDFGWPDLRLALTLFETHAQLDMRDAVHAATALNHGIDAIVSPDRAFDVVAGLDRIDPVDAIATLR